MTEPAREPRGIDPEYLEMIPETIRQLRKRLLTKEKILEYDRDEVFPEETIRDMLSPEIGLQLVFVPEAYGGMGGGARDSCAVTRELSKICLGISTAFFAIQLGADPLMVGGTTEQKARWLGSIAEGNALVAYAVTEPGAGSNLAALKTKAEPVTDDAGNVTGYIVNCTKQFISTGGYADFITLLAKTPEGPTFFVVEKGTEGFVQGKGEEKHGIRASNTSPLTFTDVFVPVENLIGGVPGQGLKQANKVFGYTRLMVAAMALGGLDAVLDIVIPYAQERIQFGSPLSEKQGYTHKLVVPAAVRQEAATAYIDDVALLIDSSNEDRQVEGSIAKYFATEAANAAADCGIQALGGYGYINEFEVEKIKRDVKITCIYEGTSEIQQNIISTFRWKKTRKTKVGFYESIAAEMDRYQGDIADAGCGHMARCARVLNEAIGIAHGNRLTRQQHVMFALADMMTHVEVAASLARKAARLSASGDSSGDTFKAMSRVFACEASMLVYQKFWLMLTGTGLFDGAGAAEVIASSGADKLVESNQNVIADMDAVADAIFER